MPTYQEYQEQIAKLNVLAEQAQQEELVEARQQIQQLMRKHGLTLADFATLPKSSQPKAAKRMAPAKYQNPQTGATWSGRGRSPTWLNGRDKNEFLIK